MKYTPEDLKGRLEKVHITQRVSDACAAGKLDNTPVLVSHALPYIGTDCLVRFNIKNREKPKKPCGNPITSYIFPDFQEGLAPEEYVLCGLWAYNMKKESHIPSIWEIFKYYNPGDMPVVHYFVDTLNHRRKKTAHINFYGTTISHASITNVLEKRLPDPKTAARVILSDSEFRLENIILKITGLGMVPILMEPGEIKLDQSLVELALEYTAQAYKALKKE